MKKVAILQSNYIPWKGYFDLIRSVDEFVLYDDMQYTKNDWRNRNKIKTREGVAWLTIPVRQETLAQTIRETKISNPLWHKQHWKTLAQNYAKAAHFKEYKDVFAELYLGGTEVYLSEINRKFITAINALLGITTTIRCSSEFTLAPGKSERLLALCQSLGATSYLSGPAASDYLDVAIFTEAGIAVEWMDYSGYPEYPQLFPPFEHGVSIVDLLFNQGKNAINFMKRVER
ncbi:WbqC family protein [Thiovibrio frasassiensis]|uniref:WbqC family protein n=1 Tax=Thiovibrio frasassiensis TaxID=2984131 RepID=A0A9X4MFX8_9BACT|nr:WbqC family protein [Thiovibrio frasassiensis]MDG4475135.1 WbqC family protein [Thiovibrio frasassiensis]